MPCLREVRAISPHDVVVAFRLSRLSSRHGFSALRLPQPASAAALMRRVRRYRSHAPPRRLMSFARYADDVALPNEPPPTARRYEVRQRKHGAMRRAGAARFAK